MTTPPTAERPDGSPADGQPAPQDRSGKGRSGPGRTAKAAGDTGATARTEEEIFRLLRRLTPREVQALAHLAAGQDLARSAAALGVTPDTVRGWLHRAMRKLGTRTPAEAAALAALLSPARTAPAGNGPDGTAGPDEPPGVRTAGPGAATAGDRPEPGGGPARRPPVVGTERRRQPPGTGSPDGAGTRPADPARPGDGRQPVAGTGQRPAPTAPTDARPPGEPASRHGAHDGYGAHDRQGAGAGHPPAWSAVTPAPPPAPAVRAPVASFEESYETAHTRLVQQVFLVATCRHRAVHCVGRAFGEARRRWEEVVAGGDPEVWVRVRACDLALSPWHRGGPRRAHVWRLPHRRIRVRPADESQPVLPDHDRLTDRDHALLKALKRLSRPQRRALVLHDGLGLPATAVAVEVESTLTAAEGRVWAARTALAHWVPDLVGPDPTADGFADRLSGLLHRAAVRACPEPHRSPVPVLRARSGLRNAARTGAAALLTVAVSGAAVATLAGEGPSVLFRPSAPPTPVLCVPAEKDTVPALPDGPEPGVRSFWCSTAPGVEAVMVAPPPPRAARPWELTTTRHAAPLPPPPGPVDCTRRPLRPCAADDG
ncbi:LuxR C-terminal-related transcriptional regulator [Kitasatospora sp. NPDC092286]|uniref:LuxR C-terminal-related transcriptional regulator n=1 Tax=Kitasatospora sp. NPDC092286 TaxID=3364087 RepID=UPI00380DB109